jgi:catechol 2,3-dioxygenase-like lactoylglutathione lyase family enzyme
MSRLQLALNVDDLEEAVTFYSRLFASEPAKRRPGYANFAIAEPPLKLVLFENPGQGGSINHLGVEVDDVDAVTAWSSRVGSDLATTDQAESTCCYAKQEKFWIDDAPDRLGWEVYAVLEDSATFAGDPEAAEPASVCCAG